jgi:hypothetical protein
VRTATTARTDRGRRDAASDGRLPTFLVIGAMKAGTDSLWQYLRAHPDVTMSETKELDFFVSELNWRRGLDWYRRQFAPTASPRDACAVGEASTSYSKFPTYDGVAERICATLPGILIVYLIREPVDRIRSQYQHQVLLRLEGRPLARAVLEDPSYVDFSRYAMQLERYLRRLPQDRLLVVASEDLRTDRRATMERVLRFLGVDAPLPDGALRAEHHATAAARVPRRGMEVLQSLPGYRALSRRQLRWLRSSTASLRTRGLDASVAAAAIHDDVRDRLRERLLPDVERLHALLGPSFSGWGWD